MSDGTSSGFNLSGSQSYGGRGAESSVAMDEFGFASAFDQSPFAHFLVGIAFGLKEHNGE
jgi:hypothetical protein